jgi:2-keto-4-pentenoate hydratase/2-oxohepta-3-ene-1,7-dioic acid hydratase in catechol pathway
MKIATIYYNNMATVAIVVDQLVYPLPELINVLQINSKWDTDMKFLIENYLDDIVSWYNNLENNKFDVVKGIPFENVTFLPLYVNPDKIWGIGLNYADHATDLDETTPSKYPGSFMRPSTTIIGHKEIIQLAKLSERSTGEGELGIIIKKKCKAVNKENWLEVVAGFTTVVDVTAEDILRLNPRFLTLAKSFDTYFSFGPVLITADEFTTEEIMNLEVSTLHNNNIPASNVVANMRYPPDFLVAFHSEVMTLLPGDIISTGTPRAKHIINGDIIGTRITGFYDLINIVNH